MSIRPIYGVEGAKFIQHYDAKLWMIWKELTTKHHETFHGRRSCRQLRASSCTSQSPHEQLRGDDSGEQQLNKQAAGWSPPASHAQPPSPLYAQRVSVTSLALWSGYLYPRLDPIRSGHEKSDTPESLFGVVNDPMGDMSLGVKQTSHSWCLFSNNGCSSMISVLEASHLNFAWSQN
ncbi:unnamed protein product [Phytophthora fragariaefolia]|uniref:Unnamed protein product n=1 Tax=Phytophthora fragariaefolia TaxID=1490495 RepID=A0A9W6XMM5_9STRA|nr:unnamed protein product [Phytophthora fragariaefolia]